MVYIIQVIHFSHVIKVIQYEIFSVKIKFIFGISIKTEKVTSEVILAAKMSSWDTCGWFPIVQVY